MSSKHSGTTVAEGRVMTLRRRFVSAVVALAGLSLVAGCRGPTPEAEAPWASPLLMDGARNEVLTDVATDTHVPVQVLFALAYQQSRFQDPDLTFDSPMNDTIDVSSDPELAAATDPWNDASPDEDGEPLQQVDDTTAIEGLEDVAADIAANPTANDYSLGEGQDANDGMLAPTVPLPTSPDPTDEDLGEEHPETDASTIFFLTPAQVTWAAQQMSMDEDEIRSDLDSATRATAALLIADLAVSHLTPETASHERWEQAMVRFVGLDPADDAGQLAQTELHSILTGGFDTVTEDGEELIMVDANGQVLPDLRTMQPAETGIDENDTGGAVTVEALSTDYPSTEWIPASSSNYTNGRGMSVRFVVIHDMEGTMNGAISVFRNAGNAASAHYLVRSHDGHIVQMVREADTAWHAGNWIINHSSIGIEHEGFADRPHGGGYYTSTLYESSAHLTCAIAHRYHIPVDRHHIFGHGNVSTNSNSTALCSDAQANAGVCGGASHHHDPGRYWDWNTYMNLVARCVSGHPHTTPTPTPPTPHPAPSHEQRAITTGWGGQHAAVDSTGALHVFATDSAHRLVEMVRTDGHWASYHVVPTSGAVHGYPAAITSGSRIVVAVRGTDDHIHVARLSGGTWSSVALTGVTVNTMPSLFVNADERVEIFVRGASDNALHHAAERSPDGDFGQWWNLGGNLRTMPTVVGDSQHRPHVFAIGDADGHVWTRVRTSANEWPSWTYLNMIGNAPVSPVLMPDGRIGAFTRNHTGALVAQFTDTSTHWGSRPQTVGGIFTSNVVAVVDSHGRVNVFGRGRDSAIYRIVQSTNGHWGSHARLGGHAIMGPAVVRTSSGLELFVAGTNHGLYHAYQSSASHTGWTGWQGRGGRLGWL